MSHAIAPPDPHKGERFRLVNRCDGQGDRTPPLAWDYRIERCVHLKTGQPYWVVVVTGADAETFAKLKDSAKAAGGKYVRAYRGNPGGLSFETEAAAVEWSHGTLGPETFEKWIARVTNNGVPRGGESYFSPSYNGRATGHALRTAGYLPVEGKLNYWRKPSAEENAKAIVERGYAAAQAKAAEAAAVETVADLLHQDPDAQDRLVADLNDDPTVDLVTDLNEITSWVVVVETVESRSTRDSFPYDSYIEAEQVYEREIKAARELSEEDGVTRRVSLVLKQEEV